VKFIDNDQTNLFSEIRKFVLFLKHTTFKIL